MKDVLERLVTARDVRAAAVFDNDGFCLASHGDAALETLGRSINVMLSETTMRGASQATWVIARYEQGTIALRRTNGAILMVVGEPQLDVSIGGAGFALNIALQVVSLRVGSRRPPVSQTIPVAGVSLPAEALRAAGLPKI